MSHPPKKTVFTLPRGTQSAFFHWTAVAALTLVTLWAGRWGVELIRADLLFMEPRHQISQWVYGREQYTHADWARAYSRMRQAIELSPKNPVLHEYMGSLLSLRGQAYWKSDVLRNAFFLDARKHQRISVKLRPTNGRTWAGLALSLYALNIEGWELDHAIGQAVFYAPHDTRVEKQIAAIVMARWSVVEPRHRNWLRSAYRDENTRQRLQLDRLAKTYGIRFI